MIIVRVQLLSRRRSVVMNTRLSFPRRSHLRHDAPARTGAFLFVNGLFDDADANFGASAIFETASGLSGMVCPTSLASKVWDEVGVVRSWAMLHRKPGHALRVGQILCRHNLKQSRDLFGDLPAIVLRQRE